MEISHSNGYFTATIDSDDKYKREVLSITQKDDHLILVYKETYDGIAYGRLKYDKNFRKYQEHYHDCNGHRYLWTKEEEIHTYKLYEEDGKKYSIWLHIKNTFYSQHGVEIHSCSENYGQGIFKTELHKYL